MRAALVVHRVTRKRDANLKTMLRELHAAADAGADLVLYAEAALTGLINNNDPAHDLPLGQPIPGPATEALARAARARRTWVGFGLLERDRGALYDAAVLLSAKGEIALHYRRIQPQWHGQDADPGIYRQGSEISAVETPYGRMGFLLCGDLFDDDVVRHARALELDWLLFPFARCFSDGAVDQARWERDDLPAYLERVRRVGATALAVNYLAHRSLLGGAFGGALVVSGDGTLIDHLPLGRTGTLLVDLDGH